MINRIPVTRTAAPGEKPGDDQLGFGRYFTDHMFTMDCSPEKGWHDPRVTPYAPVCLDPAAMVFHYGQELFEGLKAYRGVDGKVRLFRAIENIRRLNRSCERLFIPTLSESLFMDALLTLLRTDIDRVPESRDASLYIRPFIIATDPFLGVRASENYKLMIILSPSGPYYKGGMSPTSIFVETADVRAVRGGLGAVKAGANYAATIRAQEAAKKEGFAQVLWTDAFEHRYVEEIGTSNAFFVMDGTVVTPALTGSILPGITRASCLELLKSWEVPLEERDVTVDELIRASEEGRLTEAFASGTAAVISPVGSLHWKGRDFVMGTGQTGPVTQRLYDTLTGIQRGAEPDPFGWTSEV
ncbi:MAG: branched-chain amino acid aminotransferase [Oscillospiraceae bacterium]|nr:branched-chain amino acid aminotransferase [Oscillospiraceae bacterium]